MMDSMIIQGSKDMFYNFSSWSRKGKYVISYKGSNLSPGLTYLLEVSSIKTMLTIKIIISGDHIMKSSALIC